ncbi:MAG: aminotransferase class I/II-fold pyridoxal phosphate-dependent enzyme [Ruminococcus sp.]|nr:aminotransferase class I/II-fold pyridoxal phosphate-dependent enzyme [Ruminococcus sp.]
MHGEEQEFVKLAFDTNWVSTLGENIIKLEEVICDYLGCGYAVGLSSGTSSLHLAMKLAGVKQGDIVLCSDLTFSASVNPVTYEGGIPVFIDSEYETWNMDPVALERAFEKYPEAKVVVVANLYGTPAKLDEIRAICDKHNAILIEDAAESLGATYNGVMTGTFGTYNAISFNGNKIITCSTGGMLITNDKKAADKARKWSTQSREMAPWYQHEDVGYNYRMSNIIAGIGRGQMLHIQEHIEGKKRVYKLYKEGLKDLPITMNPYPDNCEPNFWLSCILIDRDSMCEQSRTEHEASFVSGDGKSCPTEILENLIKYNAEGRPIWKPMHLQPIFKDNDFVTAVDEVEVSTDIFERGVCLPSDIKMTKEQQLRVIEIVKSSF